MSVINIEMHSKTLDRQITFNVIHPEREIKNTLLLLHGYSDNCDAWINYTNVVRYNHNTLIILPSGENSWYLNRKDGEQYLEYINELKNYCQKVFKLNTNELYVAGNSMGGYGTLNYLINYSNEITKAYALSPAIYLESTFKERFHEKVRSNIINVDEKITKDMINKLYLYCGRNDYLYDHAQKLSKQYNIKLHDDEHEHNWDAWDPQIRMILEEIK